MEHYRQSYLRPGEDRRPTLTWPRQIPIEGEPADVTAIVADYAEWLTASPVPKLFVNADPGAILTGQQRDFCRSWPNQQEVTVGGEPLPPGRLPRPDRHGHRCLVPADGSWTLEPSCGRRPSTRPARRWIGGCRFFDSGIPVGFLSALFGRNGWWGIWSRWPRAEWWTRQVRSYWSAATYCHDRLGAHRPASDIETRMAGSPAGRRHTRVTRGNPCPS